MFFELCVGSRVCWWVVGFLVIFGFVVCGVCTNIFDIS